MLYILLIGLAALLYLLFAGKRNPKLQPVALILGIILMILGPIYAYQTFFANDLVMNKYHGMLGERQEVQARQIASDLAKNKSWKAAIFFNNETRMFSAAQVKGLQSKWTGNRPLHIYSGESAEHIESPSDYTFSSQDIKQAMAAHPEADLFVFSGLPPAATYGKKIALLNVPPSRWEDVGKQTSVLVAGSDQPPTTRPSAQQKGLGPAEEEFKFLTR